MPDNIPLLEKIDACGSLLDKLTDAHGRAKCGYIFILNEYIDSIRKDVLVLEEQIKDLKKDNSETMSQE